MAITFSCGACGKSLTTTDDKAGRKAKYDWGTIQTKFIMMAYHDDGPAESPPNFSDYARKLAVWAQEKLGSDKVPDEQTIRAKLRVWFEYYTRAK
jgi:hypothetical protein